MSWLLRYLRDATVAVNAMASGSQHTAIRAMSHRPHPLQLRDEGRETFDAMNLDTPSYAILAESPQGSNASTWIAVNRMRYLDVASVSRRATAECASAADLGVGVGTVQRVKT